MISDCRFGGLNIGQVVHKSHRLARPWLCPLPVQHESPTEASRMYEQAVFPFHVEENYRNRLTAIIINIGSLGDSIYSDVYSKVPTEWTMYMIVAPNTYHGHILVFTAPGAGNH